MLHEMFKAGYWFEPKSHGYGAGLPIAWQGWALLVSYIGVLVGAALLFIPDDIAVFVIASLAATAVLLVIAARRTRGGWRWRWGK